jgi:hypothetical protein
MKASPAEEFRARPFQSDDECDHTDQRDADAGGVVSSVGYFTGGAAGAGARGGSVLRRSGNRVRFCRCGCAGIHAKQRNGEDKPANNTHDDNPISLEFYFLELLFSSGQNLIHTHAEVIVQHEHFPARDQPVVYENVDWITGQLVQLYNGPFTQPQHIFNEHSRATQLDLHIQFNILQQVDAGDLRILHHLVEIREFEFIGLRRGDRSGGRRGFGDGGRIIECRLTQQFVNRRLIRCLTRITRGSADWFGRSADGFRRRAGCFSGRSAPFRGSGIAFSGRDITGKRIAAGGGAGFLCREISRCIAGCSSPGCIVLICLSNFFSHGPPSLVLPDST